jgi:D-glycero-D-manno-heptose 1,7-bisphosphate phosphatase
VILDSMSDMHVSSPMMADARVPPPQILRPAAVLLDRDGTLVVDLPYNGDPRRVEPMPGAKLALDRLRAAGVPIAVVTNQSGIGRRLITAAQVDAVNRRVEELLGPIGRWFVCPHTPSDGCRCRKPAPELILRASATMGVSPRETVMIGDSESDVVAAHAAGARAILLRAQTDVKSLADLLAGDLVEAVRLVLDERVWS